VDSISAKGREQDERWRAYVEELREGAARTFEHQLAFFEQLYADRPAADGPPLVWSPSPAEVADSNLGRFQSDRGLPDFATLRAECARERPRFWGEVLERLGIVFTRPPDRILDPDSDVRDPRWLPGAELNIVDSCFTGPPESPAVIVGREGTDRLDTVTRAQLEAMVNRVAAGVAAHGFRPGDPIALYLPMTLECVAAYLGIIRAGCVVVSVADSFSPAELARRLEIAGAKGIVTVDVQRRAGKMLPMYAKVREADAPRAVIIDAGDDTDLRPGDLRWEELLADAGDAPAVTGPPDRTINVLFSSGTTGTPKAIPWTHLTPIKCAMDGHFHQDVRPGDVVAWPTNIGWMMGPWLIFASLVNGAAMALFEGAPNGDEFPRFVADARVTVLGVVPSLVRAWKTAGVLGGKRWPSVRVFSSTGEPSNRVDYLWLMSRTDYRAPVIEYLGGTEIGGGHITGTVVQPASPATFTTAALGLDWVLLREDGAAAGVGEPGELFLVPPSIGLSQRLLNADHDRVYHEGCPPGPNGEILRRHGDRFVALAGGFTKAEGRMDDTMNLGGVKVGSLELERALSVHPSVHECAAVGVRPGGEGAEKLVVYVVPRGEVDPEALRPELDQELRRELNPMFRIHRVVLIDALPRTASNKLMRRKLQERWAQDDGAAAAS
jgi:acetyl-CoA synthetase